MSLRNHSHIHFAGQITGVEGYVESASMGLLAGRFISQKILGKAFFLPPRESALGSLLAHITKEAEKETFQPMNINFGLMPPVPIFKNQSGKNKKLKGIERKEFQCQRALSSLKEWIK